MRKLQHFIPNFSDRWGHRLSVAERYHIGVLHVADVKASFSREQENAIARHKMAHRFDLDQRRKKNKHQEAVCYAGYRRIAVAFCSPYLLGPLRTLRQACSDILASHPELIPPDCEACAGAERCIVYDYTLTIKNKGRPPKSWRWEIYAPGKNKPVQQSEFFGTMSEATRMGKASLAILRTNRTA